MPEPDWSNELLKLGYTAQQRFNAYAVTLCFTLLGLAIETAKFGSTALADFFEIVGWISLLVAGLAGFHGLEWDPQVYQLAGLRASQHSRLTQLREANLSGAETVRVLDSNTDLNISDLIDRHQKALQKIENMIEEITGKSQIGYRIRSVAFLVGLVALMAARAFQPLLGIVRQWWGI